MGVAGGFYYGGEGGVVVLDAANPVLVNVAFPTPDVLELGVVLGVGPFDVGIGGVDGGVDAPVRQGFALQLALGVG